MIEWPLIIAIIYSLALYSILYPFALAWIPSNIAYYAYIPASFFGLEISIIFWLSRYGMLELPILLGSFFIVSCVLVLAHYWTKQGLVVHRKYLYGGLGLDLKRITRVGMTLIASFFLVINMTFSNPEFMDIPSWSLLIVVSSLTFFYISFSILSLNVVYRTKLLNEKLGTGDFNSKLRQLEAALLEKYPKKPNTIEFFSFVLRSAIDDFVYGDYERSFLDGYRIIHDRIVQDPKAIVEKKVNEKTLDEYRRIRVYLVHGFLNEKKSRLKVPIRVEDVVWARKVLFQKTLDLIHLAFYVADRI